MAEDRLHGARVGHLQRAALVVPHGKEHGHVLRFELTFLQRVIQRGEHLRRFRPLLRRRAHDAACQGSKQRRRSRLAAHVAQHDGRPAGAVVKKVVEVAADGACRQKPHCHVGIGQHRRRRRQQPQLHLAGHGDVALQLPFLGAHGLVEPRVLDSDGYLRRQRRQHALVLFVEEARARVFQVQHADHAPLVEQRHNQLRPGLGIHRQVARVLAHVGHVH